MYTAQGQVSREQLLEHHAPLVKKLAYHLLGRLPASVQVDDLIQAGMIGLLDALSQYDKTQGASFETYASIRIRGAMLDELRRTDWAPKSVHRKGRELSDAIHRVEARTGREAADREVARELGVTLDEYYRILQDTSSCRMMSYDELVGEEQGGFDRFASETDDPGAILQDDEFRDDLITAIGKLPEREQLIMSLYYEQDLNLKEIGAVLEVSESRISQLLSQAHARLRSGLQAHTR